MKVSLRKEHLKMNLAEGREGTSLDLFLLHAFSPCVLSGLCSCTFPWFIIPFSTLSLSLIHKHALKTFSLLVKSDNKNESFNLTPSFEDQLTNLFPLQPNFKTHIHTQHHHPPFLFPFNPHQSNFEFHHSRKYFILPAYIGSSCPTVALDPEIPLP